MIDVTEQGPVHDRKTFSERNKTGLWFLLGVFGLAGAASLANELYFEEIRKEEKREEAVLIAEQSSELESFINRTTNDASLGIVITDGIDYRGDSHAEIEVTYGHCSGKIPLRHTEESGWGVDENGGKKNLLAIEGEFGQVQGYYPVTPENLILSFNPECATTID